MVRLLKIVAMSGIAVLYEYGGDSGYDPDDPDDGDDDDDDDEWYCNG